jgi:hypothetical protein
VKVLITMKSLLFAGVALILAVMPRASFAAETRAVAIVVGEQAPPLEKHAAGELAEQLRQLFDIKASIGTSLPAGEGVAILIGSPMTNAAVAAAIGNAWPALTPQGHLLKSARSEKGPVLVLGGDSPVASLWAVYEYGYQCGIRYLLHGDFLPLEKPAFTVEGFNSVLEPRLTVRAWRGFSGQMFTADVWGLEDQRRLLKQLAKLKYTHFIVPETAPVQPPIRVDGDTPGRKAFRGEKVFGNPDLIAEGKSAGSAAAFYARLKAAVIEAGLHADAPPDAVELTPGGTKEGVLPQFNLERLAASLDGIRAAKKSGFALRAGYPGDLNATAHFLARASFADQLSAGQGLSDLATPICGREVDERLLKGFAAAGEAAALVEANDRGLATPAPGMIARQLNSKEPPPAWWKSARDLYTAAMNEMYRGNTRARGGARPFILYHAKRFEFAVHYLTALEAVRKAGPLGGEERAAALEAGVEALHNAGNALADVARDPSDRGAIAMLVEHAYRPLVKEFEAAGNE